MIAKEKAREPRNAAFMPFEWFPRSVGPVAELVGIEVGVVSGVMNLESSGVEASDWRPRHGQVYHDA
jgi:transposase